MNAEWLAPVSRLSSSGSWVWIVLEASLILIVGGFLTRYWPGTSAAGRHLIWLASLCTVLTLPVVWMLVPEIPLAVLPATVNASTQEASRPREGRTTTSRPIPRSGDRNAVSTGSPKTGTSPSSMGGSRPWSVLLLSTYLLGALLQAGFLGAGLLRLRRLTRDSERDDYCQQVAGRLASSLGVRRPVRVGVSSVEFPFAWGCWRPVVILPAEFRGWSLPRQSDVLAHELAHVVRLDWISLLLGRIVCMLYWPLPLAWWGARRMSGEAERACDDQVLLLGSIPADYARQLLEFASGRQGSPEPASGLLGRPEISLRIRAILDPNLRRTTMKKRLYCSALICGMLMALAAGTVRLEARAESGRAADLLRAATNGDLSQVRRLIQSGVDPNSVIPGRRSALVQAAYAGHLEVVRQLLAQGADPNLYDRASSRRFPEIPRSPLGAAAASGDRAIVQDLLQVGALVDFAPPGDGTPLILAASAGHEEVVGELLDAGADPNRIVPGNGTALIVAAGGGHLAVVERLLAAGADPSLGSPGDGTPLSQALDEGYDRVVDRLLDAGAAGSGRPERGDPTPLAKAAGRRNPELVQALLESGADPDQAPPGDPSALMEAASQGDLETISLLVEHGANPNRPQPGDGNALIAATRAHRLEAVRLLLDLGARPDAAVPGDGNALIAAAAEGETDIARLLLEQGADPNGQVRGDENPLINAARGGHLATANLLLEAGARIDTEIRDYGRIYTALGEARRMGQDAMVDLLLRHGARR